ncbi:hypothetical protein SB816_16440 [Achromobacter sp. SIMBA_011]|uniref:hypothetical protein n=1 Tax=Achromobacter TaxID=222 RepID=UPI0011A51F9B|nr:hypothetical protein [Achromobacter dolens]MCZ8407871.1 hypothetical protein [Achromobacter dolens]
MSKKLSVAFFCCVCMAGATAAAAAPPPERTITEYVYNGLVFSFSALPEPANSATYGKGRIVVKDRQGAPRLMSLVAQSPGCTGNFPAISAMEMPYASSPIESVRVETFILFCGSDNGSHNTLRFLDRQGSLQGSLDFFDGPVDLRPAPDGLRAVVTEQKVIPDVPGVVYFPVIYQLTARGGANLAITRDVSERAKQIYAALLHEKPYANGNAPGSVVSAITLHLLGDQDGFCRELAMIPSGVRWKNLSGALGRAALQCTPPVK